MQLGRLCASLTLGALAIAAVPLARAQEKPARVDIILGVQHAVSPAMRHVTPTPPSPPSAVIPVRHPLAARANTFRPDPVLQTSTTALTSSNTTTGLNFGGIASDGYIPPDTNLAVGATQVVQMVNVEYTVYDKSTGEQTQGPTAIHNIFASLGAPCGTSDGGDPVVLYDQIAGRWLISQLEYNGSMTSNYECVAISTSSDATGSYNLYAISFGNNLPDYPKWGVWPDAYYLTANLFHNGSSFQGATACALPSGKMQSGEAVTSSQIVCFQDSSEASLLPADFQGSTLPATGEPEFLVNFDSTLELYRFHVDFANQINSTFTGPIPVSDAASFTEACGGGACIPQPGTHQKLDSLGDRLMFPLTYRKFGTRESLLVAQSVQISSSGQTGIRWYEIQSPNDSPAIRQQDTYSGSGDTTTYRWMGSIAQDQSGDIAVGYSVSNGTSVYPGIRIAGHDSNQDALGAMEAETDVIDGTGHQTRYNRWGDYSSMSIDPADDCTFWYTTEYEASNGSFNWSTYIHSFKFNNCGGSTTTTAPAAPTLNTPTAGDGYVSLTWSASSGATSYNVYREASGDTSFSVIDSPATNSYTDSSVTTGTTYYYYVTAVNTAGESGASNTVSATPQASTAPSAPTNVTATSPGKSGKVNLSWTQSTSSGVAQNGIYRSINGGGFNLLVTVSATTSYSDSSVTKGTNYCYYVTAVNSSGQPSAASNSSCATPATGGK